MVNIKNFFLKSFSVVFILAALISLIVYVEFSNSVKDLEKVKATAQGYIGNAIVSQFANENMNAFDFKEIETVCSQSEMFDNPQNELIDMQGVCKKVNSGDIANSEQLKNYISQNGGKMIVDSATAEIYKQALALEAIGTIFLAVFVILYALSIILVYLISMKFAQTVETFCYYNFIIGILFCFVIGLAYLVIPNIADYLLKRIISETGSLGDFQGIFSNISADMLNILKEIILRPLYTMGAITLIGLIGWRTRFLLKKD